MLFVASSALAAEKLAPCDHYGEEYYAVVEARMRQAAPDDALWQVTVYPPSMAEWSIRARRVGNDYELTTVRLDRSLWDTGWATSGRSGLERNLASSPARATAITHRISSHLFAELEAAIRRSVAGAGVPDKANLADEINLHGVLFRFEVAGGGCGETRPLDWSETETGRLAAIVLALCNPADEERILRMLDGVAGLSLDTSK